MAEHNGVDIGINIRITLDEPVYKDPDLQRLLDVRRATVVVAALHGARGALHNAEAAQTVTASNECLSKARSTIADVAGLRRNWHLHFSATANPARSAIISAADDYVRNAIQAQRGIGVDAGKTAKQLKQETIELLRLAIVEINNLI